jgi:Flp pilus assembly protein TadG
MRSDAYKSRRRWGSRAGSAMVEFALGSTILVTVFTSAFQYGYIFYQYNALQNAVINGAHYAAQYRYDSTTSTPSDTFKTRVQNMVVYGDPTGTSTTPVLNNLATSNVNLTVTMLGSGTSVVPSAMTVSISNYTINGLWGSFTCTNKPNITYAYQGIYSPHP